jgi:hypothetical protein
MIDVEQFPLDKKNATPQELLNYNKWRSFKGFFITIDYVMKIIQDDVLKQN